ncbi:uncharacterized protein LOC121410727 [Lytechinus variegatus]|uniref:uncharacterized protein LOC121410727 n=1 Tax=Lytechinus variegatus TaxID=7654 RepID=UPI001BB13EF1|nr:uncharacterized protein LOC121410727 [Lytechinus variegatus]
MESQSSKPRPVTIGICTSALKSNIEAFINKVKSFPNVAVKFIQLPYNDLDSFRLSSEGLDGVILCHSINNRRFAITDVMDALYDKFLHHVQNKFGKENVCVIAHDFPWPMGPTGSANHTKVKETYMDSFQRNQSTTFKCSKLAIICGSLDKHVEVDETDWKHLQNFVLQCRVTRSWIVHVLSTSLSMIMKVIERYLPCLHRMLMHIYQAAQIVFSPVHDDDLPTVQRSREAQTRIDISCIRIIECILLLLCTPVIIMCMFVDCIFQRIYPNDSVHSLLRSFKKDVINKTLESATHKGLCWNVICIPLNLTYNFCSFIMVKCVDCFGSVCQYLGNKTTTFIGLLMREK